MVGGRGLPQAHDPVSDCFQVLADPDVKATDAPRVAAGLVSWLAERQIIQPELVPCVFDVDLGHPPGPRWADALADRADRRFGGGGVEVHTQRTVFHGDGAGYDRVACPRCDAEVNWDDLMDTIGAWYETGTALQRCGTCDHGAELNDLRWENPWAFGYLGLTFWNWPPLGERFVGELARRTGHRIRLVAAKL